MRIRLLGLVLLIGPPFLLMPLMMKFPGRSANTGMADSGCFGWVAAAIMTFGLILLIGGNNLKDDQKPKD